MAYLEFPGTNGGFGVMYEETVDEANNASIIAVTGCAFYSTNYYGTTFYGDGIVQVNGITVVTLTNDSAHSAYVSAQGDWNLIGGSAGVQSVIIPHNADGSGSFTITLKGRPGIYNDMNMFCEASTHGNYAYNGSKSANLTKINRTFPLSISQGSNTSVVVNRTSSPLGGSTGRLYNGATLYKGDIISVSFSAANGCELTTHTVNGASVASGSTYEVTAAVSVVTRARVNSFTLSIDVDSNTNLTVNRTSSPLQGASQGYLSNGATIYYGDVLNIVFSAKTGYTIGTHTKNGTTFSSGEAHTVTAAIALVLSSTLNTYSFDKTVSVGLSVVVTRTSSPLGGGATGVFTGDTLYHGDVLSINASANAGYSIETMSINGSQYYDNPHEITVVSAIALSILSKALGFVHIDSGATIEKYKILIDTGSRFEQYRTMIDTGSAIVPY